MATLSGIFFVSFLAVVILSTLTSADSPISGVVNGPQRTILYQITERILLLQREFNLIMRQFERTILGFSNSQNNVAATGKVDVPTLPLISPPINSKLHQFAQHESTNPLNSVTPLPMELLPGRAQNAISILTTPIYNPFNALTRIINSTFEQIVSSLNFALSNRNINETVRSNVTGPSLGHVYILLDGDAKNDAAHNLILTCAILGAQN